MNIKKMCLVFLLAVCGTCAFADGGEPENDLEGNVCVHYNGVSTSDGWEFECKWFNVDMFPGRSGEFEADEAGVNVLSWLNYLLEDEHDPKAQDRAFYNYQNKMNNLSGVKYANVESSRRLYLNKTKAMQNDTVYLYAVPQKYANLKVTLPEQNMLGMNVEILGYYTRPNKAASDKVNYLLVLPRIPEDIKEASVTLFESEDGHLMMSLSAKSSQKDESVSKTLTVFENPKAVAAAQEEKANQVAKELIRLLKA